MKCKCHFCGKPAHYIAIAYDYEDYLLCAKCRSKAHLLIGRCVKKFTLTEEDIIAINNSANE